MNSTVTLTVDDGLAVARMTRPDALNALDRSTLCALIDAVRHAADTDGVRALVLAGGPRAFCVGDDLKEAATLGADELAGHIDRLQELTRLLRSLAQPSVAAIAGYALGGGLELALACDLRIAAANARFACPEPAWGLTATGGATRLLARIVGDGWARELLLFGRELGAEEALRVGLVTRLAAPEGLDEAARDAALAVARSSPAALAQTRRLLAAPDHLSFDEVLDRETTTVLAAFASDEARDGLAAFAAGRRPPRASGAA